MERVAHTAKTTGALNLLGFEYERTITLGRRASQSGFISTRNTPVVTVSRGGLATLHNPGQTVIYPVVPLKQFGLFAKEWVYLLTEITQKTLNKCNITIISPNAGLFTKQGKIASIGIDIKGGISTHGIAINVNNKLEDFREIIPCGIADQPFDQVSNYKDLSTQEYFDLWAKEFRSSFAAYVGENLTNTRLEP